MNKHNTIVSMVQIALFAAVLAVLSQLSIPLPTGIPVTLQTFAVALTAYTLGWKKGICSVAIFLALGAVGMPVFSNFTGGIAKFAGVTGGYLWGFLPMTLLCGLGIDLWLKNPCIKSRVYLFLLSIAGLSACHVPGVFQFALVSGSSPIHAFLAASAPYLLKDILSLAAAFGLAVAIRRALKQQRKAVKKEIMHKES